LGEPSPRFGDTLGHLLLVADTGGETVDARVSATAVQTIAGYILNIMPWFYRLGGPQEDDFLRELVSALEHCHTRVQAVAEALETTRIPRVAGRTGGRTGLVPMRPCRTPPHPISDVGLIGGGQIRMQGEVSLAHRGVLCLDERPEFRRHVLEVLRQALEEGVV
jgi:Magnesium chelatase, subunit ChlI